ncbi:ABC transporter ATP-binding protein [Candidatus Woesearchaeota archaeon]|jgi:putative ABC transport system ATP-binding protein|nr:ABC transporter ATP-binding protein [Candidatus Woesearchaeota archaeon]MBT6040967.1 ABC transporter ATP-binding protein [Candidatus Woesearchaeota archaeon]MBT6336143.1 ABC transporter ATP-binding protein [Candidatus Woesearchaeota archaeon]MBT7928088.1 ABC transporter ATP-binding protein [Candidatus Woesearchaeota archaeon]
MDEIIINMDRVWKTYSMGETNLDALKNVSAVINKGEFVAITGASGSGKSTMMNIIGCLDTPTKGKVFLQGKDIATLNESQLAQIRGKTIGFIFQQFNLLPTLSALENIMLPLEFQDEETNKAKKRANELLKIVGLGDRAHHLPSQLSGGQRQRVAIARSLAVNPEIVLADEPTGNLDSKTGTYVMEFLKKLNEKENKTIIIVTHDTNLIKYVNKIFYVKDGEIVKIIDNTIRRNKK